MKELKITEFQIDSGVINARFQYGGVDIFVARMEVGYPLQIHPLNREVYGNWPGDYTPNGISPFTHVTQYIAMAAFEHGLALSKEVCRIAVNLSQNEATISELLNAVHKTF